MGLVKKKTAKIYCCTLCSGENLETLVQIDFWSAKLLTTHDVKSNIERFQLHSSFNLFYSPLSLTKSLHCHSSLRFARDGILTNEPIPKLCLTLLRLSLVTNFRQPNKTSLTFAKRSKKINN